MHVNNVCNSPIEAELLHKAIADFSYDGPRSQYANWLAEVGDVGRSNDVRKTINTYQDLDRKHLNNMSGSEDWQRMIATPLLRKFIEGAAQFDRKNMEIFRDLVFSKLKPAVSLSYSLGKTAPQLGTSRLWGLPDLPINEKWPKIKMVSNSFESKNDLPAADHCAFLGQFCFKDFANTVFGQELPKTGGFTIFTITEVHELGIVETLFLPWNNEVELVRVAPPSDLLEDKLGDTTNVPKAVHQILLKEVISLPDPEDGPFKDVIPNCSWNEPYGKFYCDLVEACGENQLGFGGYLRGTSGSDPSPDTSSIRMAVLRTNPDVGIVHFAIPTKDLPEGRLDRVEYVWNDWDS